MGAKFVCFNFILQTKESLLKIFEQNSGLISYDLQILIWDGVSDDANKSKILNGN